MPSYNPSARGPLDGITVLDLSRLVAGNMLSLQLADFGAEVIKIEDPGKGDPLRDWRVEGHSLFWKVYARNKKSVDARPARSARQGAAAQRWSSAAQVLIENYRPGTLERMGLGPDVLHARNPKLVIVRVSGWGQTGPYAQKPGFGTLVEGMSGYAAKNGFADREPVLPPTALADMIAGLYGAYADDGGAARGRDEGRQGPGDRPLAAGADPFGDRCRRGDLQGRGHRAEAPGQPLQHHQPAQRLPDPRRPLDVDLGLDAVDGRAALRRRRRARHDQGPALCHQQRASCPPRGGRAAGRASSSPRTTSPNASRSSRPPR